MSGVRRLGGTATYTTPLGVLVPSGKPYDREASIYNLTPKNMALWMVAMGKARTGVAQAKLTLVGDSTTHGSYGSTPFSTYSPAGQLKTRLDALYGNVGSGFVHPVVDPFDASGDTRITTTGSPTNIGANYGYPSYMGLTTGMTASFTAPVGVDTLTVYLMTYPNASSAVDIKIDGGVVDTVNTVSGGGGVTIKNYTVTTGAAHTIQVVGPASNLAYVLGFSSRLNVNTGVLINRLGAPGQGSSTAANGTASTATANQLQPINFVPRQVGGDCFVLQHGINDADSASAYAARMTSVINSYKAYGSVVLMTPYPVGLSTDAFSTRYPQWVTALYGLADTLDVPLIDLSDRWNLNYAASTSTFSATVHPSSGGYSDGSAAEYRALFTALGI